MAKAKKIDPTIPKEIKTVDQIQNYSKYDFFSDRLTLSKLSIMVNNMITQYGGDAVLDMDIERGYYGDADIAAKITWSRLETDGEIALRIERSKKASEAAKIRNKALAVKKLATEKKELARLLKKHKKLADDLIKENNND